MSFNKEENLTVSIDPLIRFSQLQAGYTAEPVLRGVSAEIYPGDCVAVTGTNGCGKSTLLKTLIGNLPIRGGSIEIGDWFRSSSQETGAPAWTEFGYVPQKKLIDGGVGVSVREVVQSGLLGQRRWWLSAGSKTQVAATLQAVNLEQLAKQPYHTLSGGQMQRVLIARAMIRRPKIWLLDEPLTGLDADSRAKLVQILADQLARGATMLIVLHEIGEFAPLINQEMHLSEGQVEFMGAPEHCPLPTHQALCEEVAY